VTFDNGIVLRQLAIVTAANANERPKSTNEILIELADGQLGMCKVLSVMRRMSSSTVYRSGHILIFVPHMGKKLQLCFIPTKVHAGPSVYPNGQQRPQHTVNKQANVSKFERKPNIHSGHTPI